MVEITVKKRTRSDTVRPAIAIPDNVWAEFKFIYPEKEIRDTIVSTLLSEHLVEN